MVGICGVTALESEGLVASLNRILDDPSVQARWRPGDVVVWDQRSTVRQALSDHVLSSRTLMRTTVAGEAPVNRERAHA